MCEVAARAGADLVFLDLEDACAPSAKESARSTAVNALTGLDWGRTLRAVRINGLDTPWCHDDVVEIVSGARGALDVIIVPKVRSARDVWWVDVLLTQLESKLGLQRPIAIEALIEEAEGLVNVVDISRASPRLEALIFGAGDLSASLRSRVDGNFEPVGDYPGDFWHLVRVQVLAAARAAGIDAIDAPYPGYQDLDGYRRTATHASLLGFDGKWAIHPESGARRQRGLHPDRRRDRRGECDHRRLPPGRSGRRGRDRAQWQTRRRRADASRRERTSKGSHMTASEKVGSRDSATRDKMLDATIQIMLEEGYAAATSRRVAALAGVKPALVHYYFPTMDELYLAVFRRGAAANLDRQQEALASDRPLHAFWETVSEPRGTRLLLEFMGLANHRKKIRAEISAWSERWREMQITALNFIVRQSGMDADEFPPAALAVVVASIGRTLVLEQALGTTGGHPEAIALVNRFIDRFEMPQPKPRRARSTSK